ncbi:MAG: DUF4404 family protein [Candidatus Omnitrophica bacterium]|nr:DUF4404 family protein [Candidatus Omnitrophota bacterium]MCB9747514.1 DUF4404 family protein [Candidatus Omnitrophota bacterium]
MKREKVKQVSKRLKEQLKELDAKDTASQEKLSSVLNRVDAQEHHGLVDQIEEAAIFFEVKHPSIAAVLNELKLILISLGA